MPTITLRRDSKLSLPIKAIDRDILKMLLKSCTYSNPDFYKAQSMGFGTYNIDQYIKTYSVNKKLGRVYFQRGSYRKIKNILETEGYRVEIDDRVIYTDDIKYPNKIKYTPRKNQLEFTETVKQYKEGLILAYTSFGKSLTIAYTGMHLKKRLLVCVHNTDMQRQWISELTDPETFNLDKKYIGGAGGVFSGKKAKLGLVNICLYQSLCKEEYLSIFREEIGLFVLDEVQTCVIDANRKIVSELACEYRIGTSDSHRRKDGKHFITIDTLGPVIKKFKEDSTSAKKLAEINLIPTNYVDNEYEYEGEFSKMETRASLDAERNKLILTRAVRKLKQRKIVMVFCSRKFQAARIYWKLSQKYRCALLTGKINPDEDIPISGADVNEEVIEIMKSHRDTNRDEIVALAQKKEIDCIVCTKKAETGTNINTIDHAVIGTMVTSNIERIKQIVGRVEREYKKSQIKDFGHSKPTPTVDILWDRNVGNIEKNSNTILKRFRGRSRKIKLKEN